MKLQIFSPTEHKEINITWVEVNTSEGNFVLQTGYAPTILVLEPEKPVTWCLRNGKQESFTPTGGMLHVNREEAVLLLDE